MFGSKKEDVKKIDNDNSKKINQEMAFEKIEEEINRNITIHVMPEKYRSGRTGKGNQSKVAGVIIIIGGILLMLMAVVALYFFMIKPLLEERKAQLAPVIRVEQEEPKEEEVIEPEAEIITPEIIIEEATGTEEIILDGATSTEDILVATSTPIATSSNDAFLEEATTTSEVVVLSEDVIDEDRDGLSNKEEELLGTSDELADSDGDGYSDLIEIRNLYNPNGSGKLADSGLFEKYSNLSFGYSVMWPNSWNMSVIGGEDSIIIKSNDGHFVQIVTQPNVDNIGIEDWYMSQFELTEIDEAQIIKGDNWQGVKSSDGLVVFITNADAEEIYAISYSSPIETSLVYKNIFDIIVKSFIFD